MNVAAVMPLNSSDPTWSLAIEGSSASGHDRPPALWSETEINAEKKLFGHFVMSSEVATKSPEFFGINPSYGP